MSGTKFQGVFWGVDFLDGSSFPDGVEFAKGLKFHNPQTHNPPLGTLAKWETRLRPAADVQVADVSGMELMKLPGLKWIFLSEVTPENRTLRNRIRCSFRQGAW